MSHYLFVYGTLKSDFDRRASRYLHSKSRLLGEGEIRGVLYDLGSYPALVLDASAGNVWGEVFEIANFEEVIQVLDRYEGEEYRRVLTSIVVDQSSLDCWVYEYLGETDLHRVISEVRYVNSSF